MRAWEEFLGKQEKDIGKETVEKWLRPLKIARFDACNLYLTASDSFKALWFEEHMRHKVQTQLFNNNHKQIKVHISIEKKPEEAFKKKKSETGALAPVNFSLKFDDIDPEASFESFITCENN